jgi:hypothetical protein
MSKEFLMKAALVDLATRLIATTEDDKMIDYGGSCLAELIRHEGEPEFRKMLNLASVVMPDFDEYMEKADRILQERRDKSKEKGDNNVKLHLVEDK